MRTWLAAWAVVFFVCAIGAASTNKLLAVVVYLVAAHACLHYAAKVLDREPPDRL